MNTQNNNTGATNQNGLEAKLSQNLHQSAGEFVGKETDRRYKYLEGHPRQYHFDAKEGAFSINGTDSQGQQLTFQPIAWRIFTDNILNMGTKNWAEIFFVDEKNCISAILFHGYSVDNIFRLIEPLFYDDLTLADVVITATAEKKENSRIQPKGVYHVATFSYELADKFRTKELKSSVKAYNIFRQETLTDIANTKAAYNYYNPFANSNDQEFPDAALTVFGGADLLS